MKKLHIFGLLALALALVFAVGACGGDDDDSSGGLSYDDLITYGTDNNGKEFEIVISQSAKATLVPTTGNYYVIRYTDDGTVISKGTIVSDGFNITFKPDDGGSDFYGTYSGPGTLSVPQIPVPASLGGGHVSVGGGGDVKPQPPAGIEIDYTLKATGTPGSATTAIVITLPQM